MPKETYQNNIPFISTIIPVFNYETYLSDAIQSALNQDYKNQQIIFVDRRSMTKFLESFLEGRSIHGR